MEDKKALAAILAHERPDGPSSSDLPDDMLGESGSEEAEEMVDIEDMAVEEMMGALQSNDKAAFKEALKSFIDVSRDS